jgi:DNA-binding winged helix-turn-helix (wHTH) protein
MVQTPNKRLQFDRFTLDLSRETLRVGDEEFTLRPKTLGVLRHLAEHAGCLVLKQDLHEAVWPGVAVTDDSLVQCIRELREMLGDAQHRLIKTVPRRGYLLDAKAGSSPSPHAVSLDFRPARVPPSALSNLFTEADARRVVEIARGKQLPLPQIEFETPDVDVPTVLRCFLGIWVSSKGFVNTNRQFMFMVTHVEKQGLAGGWTVRGPPAPNSRIQNSAEAVPFTAHIADKVLTYRNPRGDYKVWFANSGGGLVFRQTYVTGDMTMVALDPIWSLVEAERAMTIK